MDGRDSRPDATTEKRPNRDGAAGSGLQHQANALDDRDARLDGGALRLKSRATFAPRRQIAQAAKNIPRKNVPTASSHTASAQSSRSVVINRKPIPSFFGGFFSISGILQKNYAKMKSSAVNNHA
jgi:hypothetical protein